MTSYMDDWAVTLPAATLPGPARRSRPRRPRLAVGAVVLVLAVALVVAVVLRNRADPFSDDPGTPRAALTGTYTFADPVFAQSYTLALPAPPRSGAQPSSPTTSGSMGGAMVSQRTALLLTRMGPELQDARSAVAAIASESALAPVSDIRRTSVGGAPAFARDFSLGGSGERLLREFRFEHAGHVYAAGILYDGDDQAGLNTALAALQTLRWTS